MTDRLCLICDKPLSELNRRPVCFCHEVEGQLTKKQIEELMAKKGVQPEERRKAVKRGICPKCDDGREKTLPARGLCHEHYREYRRAYLEEVQRSRSDAQPAPAGRAVITAPAPVPETDPSPARVENFGLPCVIRVFVGSQEILSVAGRIEIEAA